MTRDRRACAWCGREIHGIADEWSSSYSEKRVERIYGGYLCHSCLQSAIVRWVEREWASAQG
jgi:ribosomal protein L34E